MTGRIAVVDLPTFDPLRDKSYRLTRLGRLADHVKAAQP